MLFEDAKLDILHSLPQNDTVDEYLPLVFIKIAIEALRRENDLEHAEIGYKLLETIIQKALHPKPEFYNKEFDINLLDI